MGTKINTNPNTKALSITLPVDLIEKLSIFVSSNKGFNVSKTIRLILEDFFESGEYSEKFKNINKDDMLVPIDTYAGIMGLGKVALQTRATKGQIKIVTIYDTDYIVADNNDVLNVFAQFKLLRERVEVLEKIKIDKQ